MYYVYMLRCGDDSLYTGLARHLNQRMRQHLEQPAASARYTKYTHSRGVKELAALFRAPDRGSAAKLEAAIKKLPREKKLALIAQQSSLSDFLPESLAQICEAVLGVSLEDCLSGTFVEQ